MENLVKYTTRLVAQYNCVIIPGLGAFLAHNVPASYSIEGATFMPPHRALGFNPQVTIDDALLVSEYIYAQHIPYDEASKMLHDDILALRRELSTKGTVCFGELGTFTVNVDGKISFNQSPNGIDDPYNFGFEPLVIRQLKDIEKKEIVIKRSTFKRFAAFAAAVILMFFFVSPLGDSAYEPSMIAGFVTSNKGKQVKESAVPETPVLESRCEIAPVADTVTENIITAVNTAAEPKKTVTEQTAVKTVMTEPVISERGTVSSRFSIIVASTPNEQKAQLAIEELSVKLEATYTVIQGGGRHRIAYGTYNSNNEAANALSQVKVTFPDAWILTH